MSTYTVAPSSLRFVGYLCITGKYSKLSSSCMCMLHATWVTQPHTLSLANRTRGSRHLWGLGSHRCKSRRVYWNVFIPCSQATVHVHLHCTSAGPARKHTSCYDSATFAPIIPAQCPSPCPQPPPLRGTSHHSHPWHQRGHQRGSHCTCVCMWV